MNKKGKGRKLVSLCVLCMMSFMLLSLMPFYVVSADGGFSSVMITSVNPTEFSPGDTKEVTVTVKNNGAKDAKDVRLAFQGTEFVSLVGPTVANINWMTRWESKDVKIVVHVNDEAPTGIYSIHIICDWYEVDTKPVTVGYKTVTTGVPPHTITETVPQVNLETVSEPKSALLGINFDIKGQVVINIGAVSTDPTDVKPGNNRVKITAFIENSGEAAAKDVEANLICNNTVFKPSWSSTDRSYIGRLNSGSSIEALFHVDVTKDIESKTYSIPLRIRYRDTKDKEYEVMRELNILVGRKPDFELVSAYTKPASLKAGDKNVKLHVKIRNTGSEKAESVTVRITKEAEVPFDYDVLSGYVGNLKIGEEGEAIMKFDVDHDAQPKVYHQGIEIRCTGDLDLDDDNVYIINTECLLEVTSGGLSIPGFEVLISLFALIFVFVLVRRRKDV